MSYYYRPRTSATRPGQKGVRAFPAVAGRRISGIRSIPVCPSRVVHGRTDRPARGRVDKTNGGGEETGPVPLKRRPGAYDGFPDDSQRDGARGKKRITIFIQRSGGRIGIARGGRDAYTADRRSFLSGLLFRRRLGGPGKSERAII